MHNRPGVWVQEHKKRHAFLAPSYALYGTVFKIRDTDDLWSWEAKTDLSCQRNQSGLPFQGYAPTLEGAKAIVETLLVETDTVPIHKSYQKEVLDEGYTIHPAQ